MLIDFTNFNLFPGDFGHCGKFGANFHIRMDGDFGGKRFFANVPVKAQHYSDSFPPRSNNFFP